LEHIRIVNLDKLNHYKCDKPAWIKLYASLLTDLKFNSLTEVQQIHLVKLILLSSQNGNRLANDSRAIGRQLALHSRISIQVFIDAGFVEIIEDTVKKSRKAIEPIKSNINQNIKQNINQKHIKKEFEIRWSRYKGEKDSIKKAQIHWYASVKTEQDISDYDKAEQNYYAIVEADRKNGFEGRKYKGGKTWFNNWRNYVAQGPPKEAKAKWKELEDMGYTIDEDSGEYVPPKEKMA